jgi:hypothetical protein
MHSALSAVAVTFAVFISFAIQGEHESEPYPDTVPVEGTRPASKLRQW